MRKVLLKKPVNMKSCPPFKGGKKDSKQKKMEAHLKHPGFHPEHEPFSLKKLRKESYNWEERVRFYLGEGEDIAKEKGFKGTFKKGANLQVLKRGKQHKMADELLKAHLKDKAAFRKPGIESKKRGLNTASRQAGGSLRRGG